MNKIITKLYIRMQSNTKNIITNITVIKKIINKKYYKANKYNNYNIILLE